MLRAKTGQKGVNEGPCIFYCYSSTLITQVHCITFLKLSEASFAVISQAHFSDKRGGGLNVISSNGWSGVVDSSCIC